MDNSADLISVVVPLFNGAEWIGESLSSIEGQSHARTEIIVVDDGSTDSGPELVATFSPDARLVRQENAGEAAARNRGLAEASGELVTFIDQDDLWHPRHLELLRKQLAVKGCDAIAPRYASFMARATAVDMPTETPDLILSGSSPVLEEILTASSDPGQGSSDPVTFSDLTQRNIANAVLARREFLISVGAYPTACSGVGDYLLMVNCSRQGTLRQMRESTAFYRLHPRMSTWEYDMALRGLSVRAMLRSASPDWPTQSIWDAYTIAKLFDRPAVPIRRSIADAVSLSHLLGAPKRKALRIVLGAYARRGLDRATRRGANANTAAP